MADLVSTAGKAFGLWRTASEVSPRVISDEAGRALNIALVGPLERCAWLREQLLTEAATPAERHDAEPHLRCFETAPAEDVARGYTFRLYVREGDETVGGRDAGSVPFSGDVDTVVEAMLELRPDLAIVLARRFPRFRIPACKGLIHRAGKANAQFALLSAIPGVLPITAPFLPASSLADVVLLTKNQAMLVMRLAAAHGHRPGYTRQVKELLGIVASALGWRTLAREAVGIVPAGIGAGLKAAIAYSGTVAAGRAALFYYQKGVKPTAAQIRQFEKEAQAEAKAVAVEVQAEVAAESAEEQSTTRGGEGGP